MPGCIWVIPTGFSEFNKQIKEKHETGRERWGGGLLKNDRWGEMRVIDNRAVMYDNFKE